MNEGQNMRAFGAGVLCATVVAVAVGLLASSLGVGLTALGSMSGGRLLSRWTPLHVTLHTGQQLLQGAGVGLGFILTLTVLSWGVKRFDEWRSSS